PRWHPAAGRCRMKRLTGRASDPRHQPRMQWPAPIPVFNEIIPGGAEILRSAPVNNDAAHPLGGRTNPSSAGQAALCAANAPIVSFGLNGGAVRSYADTGHILDTFG